MESGEQSSILNIKYNNKYIYMSKEYAIIDKSLLEKRIEELENVIEEKKIGVENERWLKHELKQILSQSTPLIPQIEKAFNSGVDSVIIKIVDKENLTVGFSKGFITKKIGESVELYPRIRNRYDYISKLDI